MTDRLFDLPDQPKLTARQQRALDLIAAAGWDGLKSEELGAALHYPKHPLNEPCGFCVSAATEVGGALRRKGFVQQRRRKDAHGVLYMVWTTIDAKPRAVSVGEFPEGY